MRFNFRKISALATSALLVGLTAGTAAAASYPAPFVAGGQADFAVVYGASPPASVLDQTNAASPIATQLLGLTTSSVGLGTDTVKIERSSDMFNLRDAATDVFVTSVSKEHLSTLLADGTYRDGDNDEFRFTQKIDLSSDLILSAFRDTDYSTEPTIGIKLDSGDTVLTYTLDFTKDPTFTSAKMDNTDIHLLGKDYFILSIAGSTSADSSLTLLDSAETTTVSEGQTVTVTTGGQTYTVTPSIFGSSNVKLDINGVVTPSLAAGDTYKLSDGSYVGIKELVIQNYQGGQKLAEFSIGAGKLVLTNGQDVQLNDETISGVGATVTNTSGVLDKIVITWDTDDREFITPTSELLMPGFEAVKVSMTDFVMPKEEVTTIEADGSDSIRLSAPIKDGTANINLLYATSGVLTGLGKDGSNKLVTASSRTTGFTFNTTDSDDRDRYFVASWNSTAEAESYFLSLQSIGTRDSANRTNVRNEVTGVTICTDIQPGGTCTVGNIVLNINTIHVEGSEKWVHVNSSTSAASFNILYTAEGLKFNLPVDSGVTNTTAKGDISLHGGGNETFGYNATSWYLFAANEDKDSNLGKVYYNFTITKNADNKLHVSTLDTAGYDDLRVGETDKYKYYTKSDVLSIIEHDRSGNQYKATTTYSGDQAYGEVYVSSTDVASGEVPGLGNVLVTASEVSAVQSRNLVVVGGSCINSVAATLVGGALCGESWTSSTGVGSGQFLIQSFASPYQSGKVALLVAGYNVDDTVNAATYLRNQGTGLDVAAGKKYTGTTATAPVTTVA